MRLEKDISTYLHLTFASVFVAVPDSIGPPYTAANFSRAVLFRFAQITTNIVAISARSHVTGNDVT